MMLDVSDFGSPAMTLKRCRRICMKSANQYHASRRREHAADGAGLPSMPSR